MPRGASSGREVAIENIPTGGGTNVGERIANAPDVPWPYPRALEHAGNLGVSLAPYIAGGAAAKALGAEAAFGNVVNQQMGRALGVPNQRPTSAVLRSM